MSFYILHIITFGIAMESMGYHGLIGPLYIMSHASIRIVRPDPLRGKLAPTILSKPAHIFVVFLGSRGRMVQSGCRRTLRTLMTQVVVGDVAEDLDRNHGAVPYKDPALRSSLSIPRGPASRVRDLV